MLVSELCTIALFRTCFVHRFVTTFQYIVLILHAILTSELDSIIQSNTRCRQASRINRGKPAVDRDWLIKTNIRANTEAVLLTLVEHNITVQYTVLKWCNVISHNEKRCSVGSIGVVGVYPKLLKYSVYACVACNRLIKDNRELVSI